jgi:hypothetical protein
MSIRIDRDPTGELARLECDECRRVSGIFLIGRIRDLMQARDWLRAQCGQDGWSTLPSRHEGQDVRVDLCRRCTRKLRKIL